MCKKADGTGLSEHKIVRKFLRSLIDKDIYPQLAALEFAGLMDTIEAAERVSRALQLNRGEKSRTNRIVTSNTTRSQPRDPGNTSKNNRTCRHCNRPGHNARYCPKKRQEANIGGEKEDVGEF